MVRTYTREHDQDHLLQLEEVLGLGGVGVGSFVVDLGDELGLFDVLLVVQGVVPVLGLYQVVLEEQLVALKMVDNASDDTKDMTGDTEDVLNNLAWVSNFPISAPFRVCPKVFRKSENFQYKTTSGTPVPNNAVSHVDYEKVGN